MQAMLYKFRSKAAGDLIMLGPQGDQLLRLLGREPARQGIIEAPAMAEAIARLEAAIAEAESRADQTGAGADDAADAGVTRPVGLRQRLWPMIEMLRRCAAARQAIVWGV